MCVFVFVFNFACAGSSLLCTDISSCATWGSAALWPCGISALWSNPRLASEGRFFTTGPQRKSSDSPRTQLKPSLQPQISLYVFFPDSSRITSRKSFDFPSLHPKLGVLSCWTHRTPSAPLTHSFLLLLAHSKKTLLGSQGAPKETLFTQGFHDLIVSPSHRGPRPSEVRIAGL